MLATARLGSAQEPSYQDLVQEALVAWERGDFTESHALFSRAHILSPNARTLRGMGLASFAGGRYLRAFEELSQALAHQQRPLDDDLRATVEEVRKQARAELGEIALKVSPSSAELVIDGAAAAPTPKSKVLLEPGGHHLLLRAQGYVEQRLGIEVGRGTSQVLHVELVPTTLPIAKAEPLLREPGQKKTEGKVPEAQSRGRRWLAYGALGLGVAAAVTSGVSFKLAKDDLDAVSRECRVPGACDPNVEGARTRESRLDARRFELEYATYQGALAVAVLSGATAVGLFAWEWFGKRHRATLAWSPTTVVVRGAF